MPRAGVFAIVVAMLAGCSGEEDRPVLGVYESTQITRVAHRANADIRCLPRRAAFCPGVDGREMEEYEETDRAYYYRVTGSPVADDEIFRLANTRVDEAYEQYGDGSYVHVPFAEGGRKRWAQTVRELHDRGRRDKRRILLVVVADDELVAIASVANGSAFPWYLVDDPDFSFSTEGEDELIAERLREAEAQRD
jgi:hypothetical protein